MFCVWILTRKEIITIAYFFFFFNDQPYFNFKNMKHFNEINALNICPLFKLFRIEGMLTLRVLGFILLESKISSELKKEM